MVFVIDLGLRDPQAQRVIEATYELVDEVVDGLHNAVVQSPLAADSEIHRLDATLPDGPIHFTGTLMAAIDSARGSLDQIVCILRGGLPTSPIALHALLRAALVGAARAVYALLPPDPETRLRRAHTLVLQEVNGGARALKEYSGFTSLGGLVPPEELVTDLGIQREALSLHADKIGDGATVIAMIDSVADALEVAPEDGYLTDGRTQLREHAAWLWNTYSGAAHTLFWPRLLPCAGDDRRIPGDYPGDFFIVAVVAHVGLTAVRIRQQPGSANHAAPLDLTDSSQWIVGRR